MRAKDHLFKLLASGNLKHALDELRAVCSAYQDAERMQETVLLLSRFNTFQAEVRDGLLSGTDKDAGLNRLKKSAIELTQGLPDDWQWEAEAVIEKKKYGKEILVAFGVLLLVFIAVYFLYIKKAVVEATHQPVYTPIQADTNTLDTVAQPAKRPNPSTTQKPSGVTPPRPAPIVKSNLIVSGYVQDAANLTGIAHAQVKFSGITLETNTDGYFYFDKFDAGKYQSGDPIYVTVSSPGYRTLTSYFYLGDSSDKIIYLNKNN